MNQLSKEIDFIPTPVFEANERAYNDAWPIICNEGGSRSSKSFSIIQLLILIAAVNEPGVRISIVSHSLPHIKRGTFRDFRTIMEQWGLWDDNQFSFSDFIYTFPNKSYLEFLGLEDEGRARGPSRDILFVNEANLISLSLFNQLAMRTTGTIFLDWNPADFSSWVYPIADDPKNKRIHSTYRNNLSNLSQRQIEQIESYKDLPDSFWWDVYGLGKRGASKELIYTNWKQIDELPGKGEVFYGLDFGFIHPAALVKVEQYEGTNYVQELIYESGLTLSDLMRKIDNLGISKRAPIYADAAEPKSIEEMYRAGYNIHPAVKDVWAGILKVKESPLYITVSSNNLKREMYSYKWKVDKEGNTIEEPVKANDDGLDAMRYAIFSNASKLKINVFSV